MRKGLRRIGAGAGTLILVLSLAASATAQNRQRSGVAMGPGGQHCRSMQFCLARCEAKRAAHHGAANCGRHCSYRCAGLTRGSF